MRCRSLSLLFALAVSFAAPASAITLGTFEFDDTRFGDTLAESDGGTHSMNSWINANGAVDPGNPGYLTGANFDTGIANIAPAFGLPSYTIGYANPIANGTGDDLGIVTARFTSDDISLSVSTDGVTFTPSQILLAASGIDSGETRDYFSLAGGPFTANLFVTPVDLDLFGLGAGEQIVAIRVSDGGSSQLDLVRVAAFVPEPSALALLAMAAGSFGALRRRA